MNSEEIKHLRELVVKNWKINKFAYLMVDETGKYPFFEKLKLKIKLNEIPNSSFDKSKHVDMKEQEALCALIQGYLATGTDKGGYKALDDFCKIHLKIDTDEHKKKFANNYFHELVIRAIKAVKIKTKNTNWLDVKRGLKNQCNEGESIHFVTDYNEEGDSVQFIHYKAPEYVEPYKIRESYFKKTLSEYRKSLKEFNK